MASLYGGFGAQRFPAPAVTNAALLDPGHEAILGLVHAAINAELGDAWRAIVASLPAGHFLAKPAAIQPVGYATTIETTPQQFAQFKASWPLLSVYREGEPELSWLTTGMRAWKQRWSVDYVIGPIDVAHVNKIGRFAIAAARVIDRVITLGWHPDYNGGVCAFFGQFAQIETKGVQGPGVQQSLTEESGSGYYGLTVTLESVERQVEDGYAAPGMVDVDACYVAVGTATEDPMTAHHATVAIETPDPE